MRVICATCDKPYRNEAPMLVWGEIDGKKTMVEPDKADDYWLPSCKHGTHKVVES